MISGAIVEVRVEPRGSQLVEDAAAGATSLLVQDPTSFDPGSLLLLDGVEYSCTAVVEVDDPDEPESPNAVLSITPPLVTAALAFSPVVLWTGVQVLDDVILVADVGGDEPVEVLVSFNKRKDWTAREGALEPPVQVLLEDDLSDVFDAPGYTPVIDGSSIDPATLAPVNDLSLAVNALTSRVATLEDGRAKTGSAVATLSAAAETSVNVTFSTPFSNPPVVALSTVASPNPFGAQLTSVSASGFTATVYHRAGTSVTANVGVQWHAIPATQ